MSTTCTTHPGRVQKRATDLPDQDKNTPNMPTGNNIPFRIFVSDGRREGEISIEKFMNHLSDGRGFSVLFKLPLFTGQCRHADLVFTLRLGDTIVSTMSFYNQDLPLVHKERVGQHPGGLHRSDGGLAGNVYLEWIADVTWITDGFPGARVTVNMAPWRKKQEGEDEDDEDTDQEEKDWVEEQLWQAQTARTGTPSETPAEEETSAAPAEEETSAAPAEKETTAEEVESKRGDKRKLQLQLVRCKGYYDLPSQQSSKRSKHH